MFNILRIIIFYIFFYVGIIITMIFSLPALLMPTSVTLFIGKLLGYWTVFCLSIFIGVKINIIGKENILKNENFFVACIHQSLFETFFLQTIIKSPIFILKKELLKMPFFGWYLKKINSIAIERNTTTKNNLGFFDKIVETIKKTKRPLIIFPQGTRTPSEVKTPFKKGVARIYKYLNIRCLPIALNSGNVWPKKNIIKVGGIITVSILKPISANLNKDIFLKTLEENTYFELDRINNLKN